MSQYSLKKKGSISGTSRMSHEDRFHLSMQSLGLIAASTSLSQQALDRAVPGVEYVEDDSSDDELDSSMTEMHYGNIRGAIVGVQYYRGMVSNQEMVSFVREPNNPYDKNAIKVTNGLGQQVGHIKRELASALAPIMDNSLARLEGTVPSGADNKFSIPLEIGLFGESKENLEKVQQICQRYMIHLVGTQASQSTIVPGLQGASGTTGIRSIISQIGIDGELDKLFDQLDDGDKTTQMDPCSSIVTPLYPHQKQALNWMTKQESGNKLPPFWSFKKNEVYVNSVTNLRTTTKPDSMKGGILADDMGLGKTLVVISLIMTNFEDSQPLAIAVPGSMRKSKMLSMWNGSTKPLPSSDVAQAPRLSAQSLREKIQRATSKAEACLSQQDIPALPQLREENQTNISQEIPTSAISSAILSQALENISTSSTISPQNPTTSGASDCVGMHLPPFSQGSIASINANSAAQILDKSASTANNLTDIVPSNTVSSASVNIQTHKVPPETSNIVPDIAATKSDECATKVNVDSSPSSLITSVTPQEDKITSTRKKPAAKLKQTATNQCSAVESCQKNASEMEEDSGGTGRRSKRTIKKPKRFREYELDEEVKEDLNGPPAKRARSKSAPDTAANPQKVLKSCNTTQSKRSKRSQSVQESKCTTIDEIENARVGKDPVVKDIEVECVDSNNSLVSDNDCFLIDNDGANEVGDYQEDNQENTNNQSVIEIDSDLICIGNDIEVIESTLVQSEIPSSLERSQSSESDSPLPMHIDLSSTSFQQKTSDLEKSNQSCRIQQKAKIPPSNTAVQSLPQKSVSPTFTSTPTVCRTYTAKPFQLTQEKSLDINQDYNFKASDSWPNKIQFPKLVAPDEIINLDLSPFIASQSTMSQSSQQPSQSPRSRMLPTHILDKLDWELRMYYREDPLEFVCRWQDKLREDRKEEEKALKDIIGELDDDNDSDELPDIYKSKETIVKVEESTSKGPVIDKAFFVPKYPERYNMLTGRHKTINSRATLIISPLSVMGNWIDQLEEHIHPNVHLEIYQYYGSNRINNAQFLSSQDVVLSTYQTVASEISLKKANSVLLKVQWFRVILDEGHHIRNAKTTRAKAINQLNANRKWVLTGTPIQNKLKDLWSIVQWLDIKPFDDYSWWKRTLETPLKNSKTEGLKRVKSLMRTVALRRLKTTTYKGKPLVKLPEKNIYLETLQFSKEERESYDIMQRDGRIIIGRYYRSGKLLERYGEVLAIILRLRQICCHQGLLSKAAKAAAEALGEMAKLPEGSAENNRDETEAFAEQKKKLVEKLIEVFESGSMEECAICMDNWKNPVITYCAHVYCRPCIERVIDDAIVNPPANCPLCRQDISKEKLLEMPKQAQEEKKDEDFGLWESSTKVNALITALKTLRETEPQSKSIVVSQFTSFLNIIEVPLKTLGIKFTRLDGTMSKKQREQAIAELNDLSPGSPTVMLLSLTAGGEGLNLTAANRMFLMEPAWNPATEDQCFDRIHRLGQKKDVFIIKYVIEDSIEGRMLELQEKKRQLMKGAFGKAKNQKERRQDTIDNIRVLMNL